MAPLTISVTSFARGIGRTPAHVRQLIAAGYLKRTRRGKLHLEEAASGYRAFMQDRVRRAEARAGSTLQLAKAAEINERVAEREATLIPVEDVFAAIDLTLDIFWEVFGVLPERFSNDPEIRHRLQDLLDAALAAAQARRDRAFRNVKAGYPAVLGPT